MMGGGYGGYGGGYGGYGAGYGSYGMSRFGMSGYCGQPAGDGSDQNDFIRLAGKRLN